MTLGESLNNPLDIKRDGKTVWLGQAPDQPDATFVKFASPEYCYRAGTKILASYAKRGIVTVQGAIYRWAPPSDRNDTEAYVQHVIQQCLCSRGTPFMRILPAFLRAMTVHEQGKCEYPDSLIAAGIALAQEQPVSAPEAKTKTTMSDVMAHPATQKVITGGAAAAFIGMELAKFHLYDMSAGETVALGVVISILFHRLFPQGLSAE